MEPPCPHCDQPDLSLLRLVLIGELLVADETLLLRLAAMESQTLDLKELSPEIGFVFSNLRDEKKAPQLGSFFRVPPPPNRGDQ